MAPHWIFPYWILQCLQTLEQWCHSIPKQAFLENSFWNKFFLKEYFSSLSFCVSTQNSSHLFPLFGYRILLFVPVALDDLNDNEFHSHLFPLSLFIFHNILLFHTNHGFDFTSQVTSYVWLSLSLLSSAPLITKVWIFL